MAVPHRLHMVNVSTYMLSIRHVDLMSLFNWTGKVCGRSHAGAARERPNHQDFSMNDTKDPRRGKNIAPGTCYIDDDPVLEVLAANVGRGSQEAVR